MMVRIYVGVWQAGTEHERTSALTVPPGPTLSSRPEWRWFEIDVALPLEAFPAGLPLNVQPHLPESGR